MSEGKVGDDRMKGKESFASYFQWRTLKLTALFTKPPVGVLPAGGMVPRGCSNCRLHSRLMGVSGIVPGKIMERPGTVRPVAL